MRLNYWEGAAAGAIVLFGAVMAYVGSSYGIGTLTRMGPGYFPLILGLLTMVLGVLTFLEVRHSEAPRPDISLRAFLCVFAGFFVWALTVERFGLLPASIALIVLCSLGRAPVKPLATALTAVLVSGAAILIFLNGFNLPLRTIRW